MITNRGALIVVEGVDRSGKSTQCRKLVQSLKNLNIKSELITFPDRTTLTGKLINEYLTNKECKLNNEAIHLLFTANRWESVDKMKSLLSNGITLIVDRYCYSGIVFSAVKESMNFKWCMQPENGLPKPDLVFLLTLSQEEMLQRPGFGNERYENADFQKNVANLYNQLYDLNDNWIKINASGTIDNVQKQMVDVCIKSIKNGMPPLKVLDFNKS